MVNTAIKSRSDYRFDRHFLNQKIKNFFRAANIDKVEVSIAVVGKRKMRQLNQQFRQLDKISDVLAFPQQEFYDPEGFLLLGDIVVCYPKALEEALAYQESIDKAIWDFVEHGLNRLLENT